MTQTTADTSNTPWNRNSVPEIFKPGKPSWMAAFWFSKASL